LQSTTRGTIFKGGIGSGKTLILCRLSIIKALQKRRFCIVSFSYPMLRDVVQYTMQEELPKMGLVEGVDYTILRGEHTIKVHGTEILMRSGDRPDSLRGLNIDDFGIDEAREFKDGSIFDIMIGRLRGSTDGQWYLCTTTKGKNWHWELEHDPEVTTVIQTTFDNPFLPEAYKAELQKRYTHDFARQELYAETVEFGAGIIKPEWFKVVDYATYQKGVRFWDLAVSIKTSADYSAGALCSFSNDVFVVHDIVHGRFEYPDIRRKIIEAAQRDGPSVTIGLEEAGQQRGFIDDLKRIPELRGYIIKAKRPYGDKLNRAMPWASRAELGIVQVCRGMWNKKFFEECADFTADDTHQHDDMIDAVSGAYHYLIHKAVSVGRNVRF